MKRVSPNRLKIDGAQIVVHQWASSVGVGTVADVVGAAELDTSSRIWTACSTALCRTRQGHRVIAQRAVMYLNDAAVDDLEGRPSVAYAS